VSTVEAPAPQPHKNTTHLAPPPHSDKNTTHLAPPPHSDQNTTHFPNVSFFFFCYNVRISLFGLMK